MVEGADGLEPHNKVCADLIGESFRDAFEDNFPTVTITGALHGRRRRRFRERRRRDP